MAALLAWGWVALPVQLEPGTRPEWWVGFPAQPHERVLAR